jgi:hypothetical protein
MPLSLIYSLLDVVSKELKNTFSFKTKLPKGKWSQTMGTWIDSCLYLYNHEVLYLQETNQALVIHQSLQLSKQELYNLVDLKVYFTFRELKQLGYTVRSHYRSIGWWAWIVDCFYQWMGWIGFYSVHHIFKVHKPGKWKRKVNLKPDFVVAVME